MSQSEANHPRENDSRLKQFQEISEKSEEPLKYVSEERTTTDFRHCDRQPHEGSGKATWSLCSSSPMDDRPAWWVTLTQVFSVFVFCFVHELCVRLPLRAINSHLHFRHSFSKFTAPFRKPFDKVFVDAMVLTANDLVLNHGAQTGYCHSDQISLLFAPVCTKEEYENKTNNSVRAFNGTHTPFDLPHILEHPTASSHSLLNLLLPSRDREIDESVNSASELHQCTL